MARYATYYLLYDYIQLPLRDTGNMHLNNKCWNNLDDKVHKHVFILDKCKLVYTCYDIVHKEHYLVFSCTICIFVIVLQVITVATLQRECRRTTVELRWACILQINSFSKYRTSVLRTCPSSHCVFIIYTFIEW